MSQARRVRSPAINLKRCTYILPIRRNNFSKAEGWDFADYFRSLSGAGCEVLIVDGSPAAVFEQYHQLWDDDVRHIAVDRRFGFLNDKVNGIHTGVEAASSEKVILADDDIRYTPDNIDQMCKLLDEFEVVRPQNYLADLQWWALTESARMLINRATLSTADYPGTCAFRRATMLRAGHYDGDVLFDNEEIIRHLARKRARIAYANDFFILKRPPTFRKWLEQRPRQAYEDFGLRTKTALFASLLPIAITVSVLGGLLGFALFYLLLSLVGWATALLGRRRGLAARYFDFFAIAYAPMWIIERAFSTYWAFYWYFRYGGYPFGDRLLRKGIGRDWREGGKIAARIAVASPPK